jgi:hypothetical protein
MVRNSIQEMYHYFLSDKIFRWTFGDYDKQIEMAEFLPYITDKYTKLNICSNIKKLRMIKNYGVKVVNFHSVIFEEIGKMLFDIKIRFVVWYEFIKNYFSRAK